jgi:pilus assembly protein Flp/PilA
MLALYLRIRNWLAEREEGQDLIEYALLVALIAIGVIAAFPALRDAVLAIFQNITSELGGAIT